MPALNIDTNLIWILVVAFLFATLVYLYFRARTPKPRDSPKEPPRGAGEQSKVVTIKGEGDGRSRLAVVTRPFKALVGRGGGSDETAINKEAVVRMLEGLNERAKNAVKDTKGLSGEDEALKLAALDSAFKYYEEIIVGASDEQFKDVQFPLNAFAKSIEERTSEAYGVQKHAPESIRELIGFGEWCAEQNYTLEKVKRFSLIGDVSHQSFLEVVQAGGTEPPKAISDIRQFYAALPKLLKGLKQEVETLKDKISTAEAAVEAEKNLWSNFAEEKRGLTEQIANLGATVKARETDIGSRDSEIGALNTQVSNLTQEKDATQEKLNTAQATLKRLARVGRLTERLTNGRQSLDYSLANNEYRVYLAFLVYYSLLNMYAGIVSNDAQKEDLMLVNLYRVADRCEQYKGRSIPQFKEVHAAIGKELAARHEGAGVEELKDEYARKAKYETHSDRNLFSLVLSALRENCDISLTPFFMDTQAGEPVGAN